MSEEATKIIKAFESINEYQKVLDRQLEEYEEAISKLLKKITDLLVINENSIKEGLVLEETDSLYSPLWLKETANEFLDIIGKEVEKEELKENSNE